MLAQPSPGRAQRGVGRLPARPVLEHEGQVAEADGGIGVIGAQHPLRDGQGPAEQEPALPGTRLERRQVVRQAPPGQPALAGGRSWASLPAVTMDWARVEYSPKTSSLGSARSRTRTPSWFDISNRPLRERSRTLKEAVYSGLSGPPASAASSATHRRPAAVSGWSGPSARSYMARARSTRGRAAASSP